MKQTMYRLIFTALAAIALLTTSCSKEPQKDDLGNNTYLSLSIDGIKAASSTELSSRAAAVDESVVNDLWVLQFQMNAGSITEGTLVAKSYIATVDDPAKIKFAPIEGDNMALYLVANSGNSSLFSSTTDGTTFATIKATVANVTATAGNNFPKETSTNLPMVGQSAMLTLPTTTAVPVTLTRMAAKVVLTIKNKLETSYPQITISTVQLKNAPKVYSTQTINTTNGFDGSDDTKRYPAALAANFMDYTAVSGNITAAGTISTYYLAPNVRGISTNTNDRLKSDLTAPSLQGDFCTYVEIIGKAKVSAITPEANVRYRLYLGNNNTNNFNLEANTAYKVNIELTGINGNDARMTIITDKFDLIQGGIDGDNIGDIGGFEEFFPAVGDYYYSDGSYSTALDKNKTATGMIYIDPVDPKKYKVMSLEESATTMSWAATDTYVVSGAQSDADGKANSDAIMDYFEANIGTDFAVAFPAAAYCYNYKGIAGTDPLGSWYLPAKNELQYLWCAYNDVTPISWENSAPAPANPTAQAAWNARIKAGGGAKDITSGRFWSSPEYSNDASTAWYVNLSDGFTDFNYKSYSNYVRCVRDL